MKLTIHKEDLEAVKQKYGKRHAVSGYAEQAKLFVVPLPKFYLVVVDDENLTLSQLDIKLKERSVEVIPLTEIENVHVSGLYIKKVTIETTDKKIKLNINPLIMGLKEYQRSLISKLESL